MTTPGIERISAVVTDLVAGMAHSVVASRHGISRQRVGRIAREAGIVRPRGGRSGDVAIATRVRALAEAAGDTPDGWLTDAAQALAACDSIVVLLHTQHDGASPGLVERVIALAVGRPDPALAKQVRAVVDAAVDG